MLGCEDLTIPLSAIDHLPVDSSNVMLRDRNGLWIKCRAPVDNFVLRNERVPKGALAQVIAGLGRS
jgi:hypothetical protein